MKPLMIATANAHKVAEFKQMLEPLGFEVKSLLDLKETIDIEETGTTFEENALIKARTIYEKLHIPVISDDSGLAVNAMNGAPGVYSARFMGYDTSYDVKNNAIIEEVKKSEDKRAQYVCAIAYVEMDGQEHVFTGIVEGEISEVPLGDKGFGYDPIFYYPPFETTLANVSEEQKNSISHRSCALKALISYMEGTTRTIHVVLFEPEIPQNTGNIMRTCMASNCKLHLIEPLGFSLDEKHLRRSAMDYVKDLDYHIYPNWESFVQRHPSENYFYMTRYGKKAPSQFDFASLQGDIYLILGKESTGIPKELLAHQLDHCMRLPMVETARSLNLSNCAAIIIYEVLRQLEYPGLSRVEVIKGEDWLEE